MAEAVLADGFERACLAFRFQGAGEGFSGHGWYCPPLPDRPEPREIACLLDRLTRVPASPDRRTKAVLAPVQPALVGSCDAPSPEAKRKSA